MSSNSSSTSSTQKTKMLGEVVDYNIVEVIEEGRINLSLESMNMTRERIGIKSYSRILQKTNKLKLSEDQEKEIQPT